MAGDNEEGGGEGLTADLIAEIDAGVAEVTERIHAGLEPEAEESEEAQVEAEEAPAEKEEKKPEEEAKDESAPGPSEEAIERAVRAGLSLKEIKQFPSDDLLNAMCARIEGVGGDPGSTEGAGNAGDGGEASPASVDDLLSTFELDPEVYDDKIVAAFKAASAIVKRQDAIINELRGGQSRDWFSEKLEGVKDLTKGDAAKTAALRDKFDVLRAGYKAARKNVPDDAVFEEAARLALGSEMESAKLAKKGDAARRRSNQRIARVSGSRVHGEKPDARSEVAELLDSKFRLAR